MGAQNSEVMLTGVDKLINILKGIDHIEVADAARKLNYPLETVQSWVDFLVEEQIIGIEYTLTKPFIYLVEGQKTKEQNTSLDTGFKNYKTYFQTDIKNKGKSAEKAEIEWKVHILQRLDLMKQFFYSEADKRKLNEPEKLWEEYRQRVSSS